MLQGGDGPWLPALRVYGTAGYPDPQMLASAVTTHIIVWAIIQLCMYICIYAIVLCCYSNLTAKGRVYD